MAYDPKTLKTSFEARANAIAKGVFVHFTNTSESSLGQLDSFVYSGPFIVHDPKGTDAFSAAQMKEMGMVGIYRCADNPAFTAYDPRLFARSFGKKADNLKQIAESQVLTWGWRELGNNAAPEKIAQSCLKAVETAPMESTTLKPKIQ